MKKLYYVIPFILIPFSLLLCDYLDEINFINMTPYSLMIVLALLSFVMGNFTPTHKHFDWMIRVIMPLSYFCTMFIGGFLDMGCDGSPQLSLDHAFNVVSQDWCLIAYCMMLLIAFCASLKPIRIVKRLKSQ